MHDDKRAFARHQVRKSGKVLFEGGNYFIECIIRNISEDGALVSLRVSLPLPPKVLLWEERAQTVYECAVRWRKEHMVGLQFTDVRSRRKRRAALDKSFVPLVCPREQPQLAN